MTDRPIIFSGSMVRALLEGRKTQTRRILKPQPPEGLPLLGIYAPGLTAVWGQASPRDDEHDHSVRLFSLKDRLWVREAWRTPVDLDDKSPSKIAESCGEAGYKKAWCPRIMEADGELLQWSDEDWPSCDIVGRLRPSIHMPRWASRLTLHVTHVRVQRVQAISNDDAAAEGCPGIYSPCHPDQGETDGQEPWDQFRALWNSLHGPDAWDQNPWVVAYTFGVEHCNIDEARK